jgi:hypothetical protein
MDVLNFVLKKGWRLQEYSSPQRPANSGIRCLLGKKDTSAAPSLPENTARKAAPLQGG